MNLKCARVKLIGDLTINLSASINREILKRLTQTTLRAFKLMKDDSIDEKYFNGQSICIMSTCAVSSTISGDYHTVSLVDISSESQSGIIFRVSDILP